MLNPAYSSDEGTSTDPVTTGAGQERPIELQTFNDAKTVTFRSTIGATPTPGSRLEGPQIPTSILRDKNWARKSYLMSGDLIFPGMRTGEGSGRGELGLRGFAGWDLAGGAAVGSQVRTSVFMQMALQASSLAFLLWIVLYLLSIQTMMELLKEIHARIYCIVFALFIVTNAARLYVGATGNKTDTTNMVSTYCATTVLLQALPLIFLLSSNIWVSNPCYHLIAADIVMLVHLVMEVVATFYRLSLLLNDELEIIRLEETVNKSRS